MLSTARTPKWTATGRKPSLMLQLPGKRVIGYVRTGYFGLNKDKTGTRLGSIDLADWISQIERDVDLWYALYPRTMGGIFFDEAWNECGANNVYSEAYRLISENTKRK